MDQSKRIKMSLFVILVLLFTAVTGQSSTSVTVRVGDEVTLPCENVIKNQDKCDSTSWVASRYEGASAKEVVSLGQIKSGLTGDKSDRLSMTEKCSLVIKNVTDDDVGRYICRQYDKSEKQQGQDALVYLSVIDTEKHQAKDGVSVILFCKVLTYGGCGYTVNWLYEGNKSDIETSQHPCTARAVFKTPHLYQKSVSDELLQCNVTDKTSGQTLLCPVSPQSSCEKTGSRLGDRNKTPSTEDPNPTTQGLPRWLWFIIAAAGLAALLIIVAVIGCKKAKWNKTQMDENVGQSLNPAVTQSASETSQDTADPEDVVSYASVSYIKKTDSKARAFGKNNNDEGDTVTYSTLKPSSSSTGDSANPGDLYATVNKPNKNEATD